MNTNNSSSVRGKGSEPVRNYFVCAVRKKAVVGHNILGILPPIFEQRMRNMSESVLNPYREAK